MHSIGDYFFDTDRLVFYKKDTPHQVVQEIENTIKVSDKYEELKSELDKLDANNRSAVKKPINLIGICLTYNCQLKCNYCSYSSGSGNVDQLTTKNVLAFVIQAIKKRIMHNLVTKNDKKEPLRFFFTGGGEPTYNWKLFRETIEAIKSKCEQYDIPCYFELTTNGMINDFQRNFIKKNFNKVMISYDGILEIQNKNRSCSNQQKPSCETVENTIKAFINSNLDVAIRSTVWHYDFERLHEMCDNLSKRFNEINEWTIMPIIPSGRALDGNDIKQRYNIKKYNFLDYYIDLVEYSKRKGYSLYITTPVFNNTLTEYCCGATFADCFWLMPDKSIINCIEAERFKVQVGQIENEKVELYNEYIDHQLEVVRNSFTSCKKCLAYRFCKGGCPLKSIRDQHFNTNYRQYECSMIQQYWMYVFKKVLIGDQCFGWSAEKITNGKLEQYNILKLVNKNGELK